MNLQTIPSSELVRLFNAATGSQVARFQDRATGVKRLTAALSERRLTLEMEDDRLVIRSEEVGDTHPTDLPVIDANAGVEAGEQQPTAAAVEPAPKVVELPATGWAPKDGSKNAIMLSMVAREGGASQSEICAALGWKRCRVTLKRAAIKAGLTLKLVKVAGAESRYVTAS